MELLNKIEYVDKNVKFYELKVPLNVPILGHLIIENPSF